MNTVELYTTDDCGLCREAKEILLKLQKEYPFRIEEQVLKEDHPKYREYVLAVPVVILNKSGQLSGRIEEQALRTVMKKQFKSSRSILVFKFLEAMGFVTVGAGLFYGVTRNDEWTELYFFLAGIALFAVGRILEKRELKKAQTKEVN
jgi:thiol-disulfide isomerase/thioredoxin